MDARAEIQEIEIIGSRAYIRNHIEVVLIAPGTSPRRMSSYTLNVQRKETDDRWRLARDANLVTEPA